MARALVRVERQRPLEHRNGVIPGGFVRAVEVPYGGEAAHREIARIRITRPFTLIAQDFCLHEFPPQRIG